MIAALQPNRVRRTYLGGAHIDALTGFSADCADGIPRPEDWLASVTQAANEPFLSGEGLGRTADGTLIRELAGEELPILVKLLDSAERLVIQAHPTVPFAKAHLASSVGKTECWYFLDCAPGACVWLGFREGITRERWEKLFYTGDSEGMLACLHRVEVRAGDFVFVDGGVPHAIGGGCFMTELQEPSDLMVVAERKTPSGRPISEKKLRMTLSYEEMFDVYSYEGLSPEELRRRYCPKPRPAAPGVEEICGPDLTEKFTMHRLTHGGRLSANRRCAVAVVTGGRGTLCGVPAAKGGRFFLRDESVITAEGDGAFSVLICQ